MAAGLSHAPTTTSPHRKQKYPYIVQKFGGESVDDTPKVFEMLDYDENGKKLAVVSAFSKITDQLFLILGDAKERDVIPTDFDAVVDRSLARLKSADESLAAEVKVDIMKVVATVIAEANRLPRKGTMREDVVIGLGERISARVVAAHCNLLAGQKDKYCAVDLSDIAQGNLEIEASVANWQPEFFAEIKVRLLSRLQPLIAAGKVPVITGYMGVLPGGTMKVMDRGYSDSTLMLVADALTVVLSQQQKVRADICKTVKGVLSTDPKAFNPDVVPARKGERLRKGDLPRLQHHITKKTVARLAATGMKAVNAVAADLLEKAVKVDALVRHTAYPRAAEYTTIVDHLPATASTGFKVIAHKTQQRLLITNTSKLTQTGWIAEILALVAKEGLSVNVVDSMDNTCTILVDKDNAKLSRLNELLINLGNITDTATIGWITCAEDGNRSVAESNKDFHAAMGELYLHGVNVLRSSAAPGREMTIMVAEKHMVRAVRLLHQTIISSR